MGTLLESETQRWQLGPSNRPTNSASVGWQAHCYHVNSIQFHRGWIHPHNTQTSLKRTLVREEQQEESAQYTCSLVWPGGRLPGPGGARRAPGVSELWCMAFWEDPCLVEVHMRLVCVCVWERERGGERERERERHFCFGHWCFLIRGKQ